MKHVCVRIVQGWVTSWEVFVLHPFLLLWSFFAGVIAYGGPARSLYLHPFLFLRIFFAGLVIYVCQARTLCRPSLP